MPPTDGWTIVAAVAWRLEPSQSKALWWALARSRWHRPRTLRQHLELVGAVQVDATYFLEHICTPQAVLAVIEELVAERRLPRLQAVAIEEQILRRVDRYGTWRGSPTPRSTRGRVLPPDVVLFADTGS